MLRAEPFDPSELLENLRARNYRGFKDGGKNIGIMRDSDTKTRVTGADTNPHIIASIATTNATDLEQEVVVPEGGEFDYLLKNRKIFADHCYDVQNCIGSLRDWRAWPDAKNQRGWQMSVEVLRDHVYPMPEAVLNIAKQFGIGASVAFERLDGGSLTTEERKRYPGASSIVRKWNCIEVSLTCLPCNVNSQSQYATIDKSRAEGARRVLSLIDLPLLDMNAVMKLLRLNEPKRVLSLVD